MEDIELCNHIDTSTTSMALLSLLEGINYGKIESGEWEECIELAISALRLSTNNLGMVMDCSGECATAGSYSLEYSSFFSEYFTYMCEKEYKIYKYSGNLVNSGM